MATAKVKVDTKETAKVEYVSYSRKDDFKAIKLNSDGQIYIEHKTLADNLIKRKKAIEAKGVDFEIEPLGISIIKEIK